MVPIVLCDANIFYPVRLCDLFIRLHIVQLITLRWSRMIQEEWISKLIESRPDQREGIMKRALDMERVVQDWEVSGFEEKIPSLGLRDENDRHVLAAAIACNASYLVTNDIRDFSPLSTQSEFSKLEIITADEFLYKFLSKYPVEVFAVVESAQKSLRKPSKSMEEYICGLEEVSLHQFSKSLREISRS